MTKEKGKFIGKTPLFPLIIGFLLLFLAANNTLGEYYLALIFSGAALFFISGILFIIFVAYGYYS